MTTTLSPTATLPGAAIIRRIRRLLFTAIAAGVLYSTFAGGGKGGCAGGVTGDGGYIDAAGAPTDLVPTCVSLTLRPSPLVLIALAAIVIWALGRVLRCAEDEASALRILDRAGLAIIIVAAASLVIATVWFWLIPVHGIDGTGAYVWPFPFGSVDVDMSPIVTG